MRAGLGGRGWECACAGQRRHEIQVNLLIFLFSQ